MEKCLIYRLTCNKCRKQYVGQTVDTFRYRWNNYRSNSRKHALGISCMQEHLCEHFCDSEHSDFLNGVSITFIEKTDPTNPLQRENYWKHTLKTFAPYGLNKRKCLAVSLFICICRNWYCLHSFCCSYTLCLPLLVKRFIVSSMEDFAIAVT